MCAWASGVECAFVRGVVLEWPLDTDANRLLLDAPVL